MNHALRWKERNDDPEAATIIPASFFYSHDVFQQEIEKIFMREWNFVGHASELRDPGSFVVCDLFDQSVIVIRGRDGILRGFHNVCQHRGNRLETKRSGENKLRFVCGYHAWSYDDKGCLRRAPRSECMRDFDPSRFTIPRVRVEEFGGFVFCNLDDEAAGLNETMAGAEDCVFSYLPDVEDMRFVDVADFSIPANWKVVMDNNIEGYHLNLSGPVHKDLSALIDFERFVFTPHGPWWSYIAPGRTELTEAYGVPLDDEARDRFGTFVNITLWPTTTIFRFPYSAYIGVFLIMPTGPEESLLRVFYYLEGERVPQVSDASMHWMNDHLSLEDIDLNITTQKGLRSRGFKGGRYMVDSERSHMSEHLVYNFHCNVMNALARD